MSVVASQQSHDHRVEVATRLIDELAKAGLKSVADPMMGAYYINLMDHKGFCLEAERDYFKVERPNGLLGSFDYVHTGRVKIIYQGFGQSGATELIEPDGGFDFATVAATLALAIAVSSQCVAAYETKKAEAEQAADALVMSLTDEYFDGNAGSCDWAPTINNQVIQVNGEWRTRLDIEFFGLSEGQARQLLDLAQAIQEERA